jgi:succinate dehydrogenase/fumarate reductase flavoprotein subunit
MNSGEIFVLLIIFGAIASGIIKSYMRRKDAQPAKSPEEQRRIDALERRVQTLERIVTDRGYDLKSEFDKL